MDTTNEYIFYMFDKFPVKPILSSNHTETMNLLLLLPSSRYQDETQISFKRIGDRICKALYKEFHKDAAGLKWNIEVFPDDCKLENIVDSSKSSSFHDFYVAACTAVPIQIARAEFNRFLILHPDPHENLDWHSSPYDLMNSISFGAYDQILESWKGPILVLSSMGRQSSGKSYMLNHIAGTVFDVSGGRCTDGVWLTCRIHDDVLYVMMDFEGLGSMERSSQEDTLLSLFNAAISSCTMFKIGYNIDSDTVAMFDRFRQGVSLIKDAQNFFRGTLSLVIKDVVDNDVNDVREEFTEKISRIFEEDMDNNFLIRMYGGNLDIVACAMFRTDAFFENLEVACDDMADRTTIIPNKSQSLACLLFPVHMFFLFSNQHNFRPMLLVQVVLWWMKKSCEE